MKDVKTAQISSNAEGPEQRSQIVVLHIPHSFSACACQGALSHPFG